MLSITTIPQPVTEHATSITFSEFENLSIIGQLKQSFAPGARLAAFTGLILGGIIPGFTWTIVHFEVAVTPALWVLVAGGLLYSSIAVFEWATAAFGNPFKSVGFVVLLEGALAFSRIWAVSLSALGVLVFINAVAAACRLQVSPEHDSYPSVTPLPPSVQVNVMQQNVTPPERTASRTKSRTDASRKAADARRAREYRARRKQASQTATA